MRKYIASAILAAAVMVVPVVGFATIPQAAPAAAKKEATKTTTKAAPTHATSGVVKSVDDSTLVITKSGKKPEDMTFTLNGNTHKEGAVAVGAPVSVRYHEEGKTHVASAVTVEQAKTHSSAKK
jgi:hypothetical protein